MFKSDLFFWSSWSIIPCVSYNFVDYFLGGVFDSACLLCMSMILFLVRDSVSCVICRYVDDFFFGLRFRLSAMYVDDFFCGA